jgi:paraquat-inducible protein B
LACHRAPSEGTTEVAAADAVFPLYENREAAERRHYNEDRSLPAPLRSVGAGASPGAPVEFRGIAVGEVTDVRLELDRARERFGIPALIQDRAERSRL